MGALAQVLLVLALVVVNANCARSVRRVVPEERPLPATAELWQEPSAARDLFHGPGGAQQAPSRASFVFVARDTTGWSPGFDVRDAEGVEWSVKLGPEAQSEVVSSRILWGLGFHQPPTYYVDAWSLTGLESGPQPPGRFRPTLPNEEVIGDWSWYENPFVGSRPYGGLIVVNLILNNWDWKTSNNKIYRVRGPDRDVTRRFVVRDVGASLGRTTYPGVLKWFRLRGFGQGTRNDLPGFESQGFIRRVAPERIEFDYTGIYRDLLDIVTPADVRWACQRLAALPDAQWSDAFRAGGYTSAQTGRYVKKIRSKIEKGLASTADNRAP